MQAFSTETTVRHEGEIHIEHVPFHFGEKVRVIILPSTESENARARQEEYEAFMKGYAEGDSIYDVH